jgi:hypothetical protein
VGTGDPSAASAGLEPARGARTWSEVARRSALDSLVARAVNASPGRWEPLPVAFQLPRRAKVLRRRFRGE